jgi:hypothetical protein
MTLQSPFLDPTSPLAASGDQGDWDDDMMASTRLLTRFRLLAGSQLDDLVVGFLSSLTEYIADR